MKKASLICIALLAISASAASAAGGLNFAWTNCVGDGGVSNRNFACNVNNGATNLAVGSYIPAAEMDQVSGNEVVVDLQSASSTLDQWWMFKNAGSCRTTALSAQFIPPGTAVNCMDIWAGQASGGIGAYNVGFGGPNRARIVLAIALPPSGLGQVVPGNEYFSFALAITNAKTVGTGSCAGCSSAVCLALNSINVTEPVGVGDSKLSAPAVSNFITWQGGSLPGQGCPASVPTKNTTWGTVKALYR